MIKNISKTKSLLLFLFISFQSKADIKLPSIFGDNMVLQQKESVAIWGKSTPEKNVTVTTSWNNKMYSTKSDSKGSWKLKVQTPSAGGPYAITISDGKTLKLNDVLIGEVWVFSGQY